MADESDYTRMWSGVFTPPRIGDEDRGIYLLDDETSVGRNSELYDEETRILYDEAHPRTHPGGQRYPGPYGGGRASDRNGPTLGERQAVLRRDSARFAGEGFAGGPDGLGPSPAERAQYIQGSRSLGHPGPRGMVTSIREGRPAIDGIMWDERPPHYAPDTGNEYAHLYIDPEARGPALFYKDTTYPGFQQVDHFGGSARGARGGSPWRDPAMAVNAVIFVILLVLVAMWLIVSTSVDRAEKRFARELKYALRAAGVPRAAAVAATSAAAPAAAT